MAEFIPVSAFDLVIFGATGDLARRKLLPALWHRWLDGQIPGESRLVGSSRTDLDREGFIALAEDACRAGSSDSWDSGAWREFAGLLDYVALDATDPATDWKPLTRALGREKPAKPKPAGQHSAPNARPCVFYLSTAPSLYAPICEALGACGLAGQPGARVVLEKPIGTDLASARAINDGVGRFFQESQVFRIDHYLGKETVQNLMVLRFANTLFEPVWRREAVDHVQITVAESLGLEGRAGYYDKSGALRDMVQNHLLQLLCLTAMEPPNSLEGDEVRTEKIKVLKALRPLRAKHAERSLVRAQYKEGVVGGQVAPGYLQELGSQDSRTETYVAIRAEIDNWRWAGVPFYLRTGKRMAERRSEIVIQFKPAPHSIFGEAGTLKPNRLVMRLQPDEGVKLYVQIKEPGPGGLRIKSLPLNLAYADSFTLRYPDAYERLLMDVVRGNLALFMRRDEVEAAWAWIDGVAAAWAEAEAPVHSYQAGTMGPEAASMMLKLDGRSWWDGEQ